MPESNWACPICQASHLAIITVPEDIVATHMAEHYGERGSNAKAFRSFADASKHVVMREGNGNRWVNREGTPEMVRECSFEDVHKLDDFEPKSLIGPDVCRVCFHDGHPGLAACQAVDPIDINPEMYSCGCTEYVNEEAEGRIIVKVEQPRKTTAGQGRWPNAVPPNRTDVYGSEEQDTLKKHSGKPLDCYFGSLHGGTYVQPFCEECAGDLPEPCYCKECIPSDTPDEDERITDEAWRLVMGDRQSSYNHPARDFEATGRMWGAILTNWLNLDEPLPDIDPRIVALMLGMVKVSRESHKHKHDNLVDLIGYALCADRVERDY